MSGVRHQFPTLGERGKANDPPVAGLSHRLRSTLEPLFEALLGCHVELVCAVSDAPPTGANLARVAIAAEGRQIAWVDAEAGHIAALVDRRFGGSGAGCTTGSRPNASERAMLAALGDACGGALALATGQNWDPCQPHPLWIDESASPSAAAHALALTLNFRSGAPIHLTLRVVRDCVPEPTAAMEPFDACGDWSRRLADVAREVRFDARVVLARPTLPMRRLLALAPGDLIPLQIAPLAPLAIGGRRVARGEIGEQDGLAVLPIHDVAGAA